MERLKLKVKAVPTLEGHESEPRALNCFIDFSWTHLFFDSTNTQKHLQAGTEQFNPTETSNLCCYGLSCMFRTHMVESDVLSCFKTCFFMLTSRHPLSRPLAKSDQSEDCPDPLPLSKRLPLSSLILDLLQTTAFRVCKAKASKIKSYMSVKK